MYKCTGVLYGMLCGTLQCSAVQRSTAQNRFEYRTL